MLVYLWFLYSEDCVHFFFRENTVVKSGESLRIILLNVECPRAEFASVGVSPSSFDYVKAAAAASTPVARRNGRPKCKI